MYLHLVQPLHLLCQCCTYNDVFIRGEAYTLVPMETISAKVHVYQYCWYVQRYCITVVAYCTAVAAFCTACAV